MAHWRTENPQQKVHSKFPNELRDIHVDIKCSNNTAIYGMIILLTMTIYIYQE